MPNLRHTDNTNVWIYLKISLYMRVKYLEFKVANFIPTLCLRRKLYKNDYPRLGEKVELLIRYVAPAA